MDKLLLDDERYHGITFKDEEEIEIIQYPVDKDNNIRLTKVQLLMMIHATKLYRNRLLELDKHNLEQEIINKINLEIEECSNIIEYLTKHKGYEVPVNKSIDSKKDDLVGKSGLEHII